MKNKNFIQNLKIEKALGGYKARIGFGDKIVMFGNSYKVCKSEDKGYTILEDDKNTKFAMPTNKLYLLLKKGDAQSSGMVNFIKSLKGEVKKAEEDKELRENESTVGALAQGKSGESYRKISDSPAKWVHMGHGTLHPRPEAPAEHHLDNEKDQHALLKLQSKLKINTHPDDHVKLENMLDKVVQQKYKMRNLKSAHKTSGKSSMSEAEFRRMSGEQEKTDLMHKDLFDAAKKSVKKKQTGGK